MQIKPNMVWECVHICKAVETMNVTIHADDYGITEKQARAILALSSACGGSGALSSVSIFANSPAFSAASGLARPYVSSGKLKMALHLNLVEGAPCADAAAIPLLVNERGTFRNDFVGLLKLSCGGRREELARQLEIEISAQIERFLSEFPQLKDRFRLDSHQHTHAVPAVFRAALAACGQHGVTLEHLRCPVEPVAVHRRAKSKLDPVNLAKDALISTLWKRNRALMPAGCATSLFCGVLLSGRMHVVDDALIDAFALEAVRRHASGIEVLFHPISVPVAECLDPRNEPFAQACAGPGRDEEAACVAKLSV